MGAACCQGRKHVLCEKPCAVSAADLKEMISCCDENGVFFMDGVMFMHDLRYASMKGILDDGLSVGPIKRITAAFTFLCDENFIGSKIFLLFLSPVIFER